MALSYIKYVALSYIKYTKLSVEGSLQSQQVEMGRRNNANKGNVCTETFLYEFAPRIH